MRATVRKILAQFPALDGAVRRHVWSRLYFPEREMVLLNGVAPKAFDVAVDVGAAQGFYTWILSRKSRNVFSFEPGAHLGRLMKASIPGSNVTFHQAALGSRTDTVELYTPQAGRGLFGATVSKLSPVATEEGVTRQIVQQITLDDTLSHVVRSGRSVDFIKIDVEGHELEVLEGAARTIAHSHPVILCEIEKRHSPHCDKVFSLLRSAGYKAYTLVDGALTDFNDRSVDDVQRERGNPANPYLFNFIFQHPNSRVNVVGLFRAMESRQSAA